jgi:exonuclease V gamma subunit
VAARKRNRSGAGRPAQDAVGLPEPQLELFRAAAESGAHTTRRSRFYFSSELERLIGILHYELYHSSRDDVDYDFFRPPLILIPNRNIGRWIQMQLARADLSPEAHGVAANIDFQFLETGLWELLLVLDPEREKPRLLERADLQFLILTALQRALSSEKTAADRPFESFERYLREGAAQESGPASPRQLYQLAVRLAALFQEYEYHRNGMVSRWLEVPSMDDDLIVPRFSRTAARPQDDRDRDQEPEDPERRALYRAQRALYREIHGVGPGGQGGLVRRLDRNGGRTLGLAAYARTVLQERRKGIRPPGRTVHIFGMSQMSRFHVALLTAVGEYLDLRFYLPVLPAHWHAVFGAPPPESEAPPESPGSSYSSWSASWRRLAVDRMVSREIDEHGNAHLGQFEATPAGNGPARLRDSWGRPARELLYLFGSFRRDHHHFYGDREDWPTSGSSADAPDGPPTLLCALQRSLARPGGKPPVLAQDDSLQIIGCPGLRREAETIYQNILYNMRRDPSLRLTDIAVLVPDIQVYRPVLQAVFDAERDPRTGRLRVPYNLSDFSAGDASVYSAGVAALLDLADSEFTRKDLFGLFLNPCFLEAHRLTREQALVWLQWADRLHVFRAVDARHQDRLGIPADGRYTWQSALQRLRLGIIMTAPVPGTDFRHFAGRIPYEDRGTDEGVLLGKLSAACADLYNALQGIRAGFAAGDARALDFIRETLDRHLEPPPDRPGERGVRGEVFAALYRIARHVRSSEHLPDLALVRELLAGSTRGIPGNRGNYLAGGVTIAALQPMRPIPFRIVYVPGMGESGDFPGHPDRSILNLRNAARRIGDANLADANRMLFFENLLTVRDRLYLTYVNRDIQRDTQYHACSVVNELKACLDATLPANRAGFREAQVPLRLSGEGYLASGPALLDTAREPGDALACYSIEDRVLAVRQYLRQRPALPAAERAWLQDAIRRHSPDTLLLADRADAAPAQDGPQEIRLRDIRDFLRDPLATLVRRRLGLVGVHRASIGLPAPAESRSLGNQADEPFFADARTRREVLRNALQRVVRSAPAQAEAAEANAIYEEFFDDALRRDALPRGAFAELERDSLRREFVRRRQHLNRALDAVAWLPAVQIGDGDTPLPVDRAAAPALHLPAYEPDRTDAGPADWRVAATLQNLFTRQDGGGALYLSYGTKVRTEDYLEGFLYALILRSLPAVPPELASARDRPFEVVVVARDEWRTLPVDVAPAQARDYLAGLCADFICGRWETLPLRLIEHSRVSQRPHRAQRSPERPPVESGGSSPETPRARSSLSYPEELRAVWEEEDGNFAAASGELATLLPARFPADAAETVRRRWQLFFALQSATAGRGSGGAS